MKTFKYLVLGFALVLATAGVALADDQGAEMPAPYIVPPHALMGMAAQACPYPDADVAGCVNMAQDLEEENRAFALGLKVKLSDTVHVKATVATTDEEKVMAVGVGVKLW